MPEPQKETPLKTQPGISVGTAQAAGSAAKIATSAVVNWLSGGSRLSALQKLMAILKQAKELYDHGIFTAGEYQQLRHILLGNLQRTPTNRRRVGRSLANNHAKGEVKDALDVDSDPSDTEIMDAIDCKHEAGGDFGDEEVIDAVELGDSPDLAGEAILDAVEIEKDEPYMDIEDGLDTVDEFEESDNDHYESEDEEAVNSGMNDVPVDTDADTGASFGSDAWSSFGSDAWSSDSE